MSGKEYRFKYPTQIAVNITNRCNLKCKHCLVSSSPDETEELTYNEIKNIIDYMRERDIICLDISGGEPTLHPDFLRIIKYADKVGMNFSVATNGVSISNDLIDELSNTNIQTIRVSLDGHTSDIHDYLRGNGMFEKTVDAIKRLQEKNIPVYILSVIHAKNFKYIERFLKFIREIGILGVHLIPFTPIGRGKKEMDLLLTPQQWKSILVEYKDYEERYNIQINVGNSGEKSSASPNLPGQVPP